MNKQEQYMIIGMVALVTLASFGYFYYSGDGTLNQRMTNLPCIDTDNGDIYTGGVAYYGSSNHQLKTMEDKCAYSVEKAGSKKYLFESYCEDDILKVKRVDCQGGCFNGACSYFDNGMETPSSIYTSDPYIARTSNENDKCTDSDGGENTAKLGVIIWESADGTNRATEFDQCSGDSVMEYSCSQYNKMVKKLIKCRNYCSKGICF